jgi:hypothetical protein
MWLAEGISTTEIQWVKWFVGGWGRTARCSSLCRPLHVYDRHRLLLHATRPCWLSPGPAVPAEWRFVIWWSDRLSVVICEHGFLIWESPGKAKCGQGLPPPPQKKKCAVEMARFNTVKRYCRSQWPRGLRQGSTAARLLGLWVRVPPRAWMSVSCECCVLSGRGLCDELVSRPEESYRLWCVYQCDRETSTKRGPGPHRAVEP